MTAWKERLIRPPRPRVYVQVRVGRHMRWKRVRHDEVALGNEPVRKEGR